MMLIHSDGNFREYLDINAETGEVYKYFKTGSKVTGRILLHPEGKSFLNMPLIWQTMCRIAWRKYGKPQ
jgi:hypothetical protein